VASTLRERERKRERDRERKRRERQRKRGKERDRKREKEREREKQKHCFRERNFLLTFDKNSSKMTTNAIFLRSVRSLRKIQIFEFVKIPRIHKLQYGTHAIYVPLVIPDI
jgi:hypothetical protein